MTQHGYETTLCGERVSLHPERALHWPAGGALFVAEGILANDPENSQARRYADNCRQVLEQMYCAKLGPLTQRPEVAVSGDQMRWLSLDHRAGFLLSLVDGSSSVEELLDISGMPRFEALRTLCDLLEQNVIALSDG